METIKTWQERTGDSPNAPPFGQIEKAMCAEIADLRAALKNAEHRTWCAGVNEDGAREHLAEVLKKAEAAPVGVVEVLAEMIKMMDDGDEHGAGSDWHQRAVASLAQRAGIDFGVPAASGKSPCIEDRDGIPAAMRMVIQSSGSVEALRGLYRLVNIWGAEQRAAAESSQPDSGRDAALTDDDCDDVLQRILNAKGFSQYLNGDTVKLYATDIRKIIRDAMAAQQGEKGGA